MQMAVVGRCFALALLLQLWIIPKLVFSQQRCLGGFDIYFILDKSGSVPPEYFKGQTVDFVEMTVENFVGKGARFSFITFSDFSEVVMKLTGDRAKIKEGLNNLRNVSLGGGTEMENAIFEANNQVKDQAAKSQSAFSIFILLTDGGIHDLNATIEQSKKAKQAGTIIYAIGVASYQIQQLNTLASKPAEDFVMTETSYLTLLNLTIAIANRTCVEITSVNPQQACLGEKNSVTMYGRGFEKFSSDELHYVQCGFKFNNTNRQVTNASLVEENRLVCPLPDLHDAESVLMLQVSLNSGQTFVSSNVNITAKNCTEKKNEKESGGETKPEIGKWLFLALALLFLFALLILLAAWWFWPRFSKRPAVASEPKASPAPPVEKTASGTTKWPTVDASFYGGRTAGGIVPVRVEWGGKGSTEAGSRLAQAKPLSKDPKEAEAGAAASRKSPGCWTATKLKVMAGIGAISDGYRRVASHRPQRGGHWLYSSDSTAQPGENADGPSK